MLEKVIKAAKFFFQQGWVPATSGNFSVRPNLDKAHEIYISLSGKHKGQLEPKDFIQLDLNTKDLTQISPKPSAETLLHTTVYKYFTKAQCILHVHSPNAVIISKLRAADQNLLLTNYEILKALSGVQTHEHQELVPIFTNTQDIAKLSTKLTESLKHNSDIHGFLIEGHGLYTWADSVENAVYHVEAFENLFACELKLGEQKSYELA